MPTQLIIIHQRNTEMVLIVKTGPKWEGLSQETLNLIYIWIFMVVLISLNLWRHNWQTKIMFSSVQSSPSVLSDSAAPWTSASWASLSITNSWSFLKIMSIELVMPPNHLILCRPFLILPFIFPSIRVFSKKSVLRIRWPKNCSFSFSISPFNEYSGLISFRMDWFDLLEVQGTLKSLL